eukprot:GFUD01020339.1.p1 GENE.GFUD01020339.1~~GFUD01020339.1.p1  ORF type:complete len:143 (-),score=57.55 GFUD01020339.1:271-699(-)
MMYQSDAESGESRDNECDEGAKAEKCHIIEMNNNTEFDITKLRSSVSYPGWDNPFLPSGCVSTDADLIVRLWKERRLDQLYCKEGLESDRDQGGKESGNSSNGLKDDKTKLVPGNDNKEELRNLPAGQAKKTKFKENCCSIM